MPLFLTELGKSADLEKISAASSKEKNRRAVDKKPSPAPASDRLDKAATDPEKAALLDQLDKEFLDKLHLKRGGGEEETQKKGKGKKKQKKDGAVEGEVKVPQPPVDTNPVPKGN
jgi:hypothetical protein